ncbi:hypothetical protein [Vulcanisaeta distributa]|uniref:hypothetical protein n=1 Tax=Vulcanisaeta distributa TaxID=164451 RepID=UPI001FB1A4C4|nr:hypothetical protein [Vulcanisaeta distributa]
MLLILLALLDFCMRFVRESMYKFIKDPGDVRVGEVVKRGGWVNGDVGILGIPWDGGAVGTRPGSSLPLPGLGPGFTPRPTSLGMFRLLTLAMLMWLLVIIMRLGVGLRRLSMRRWGGSLRS